MTKGERMKGGGNAALKRLELSCKKKTGFSKALKFIICFLAAQVSINESLGAPDSSVHKPSFSISNNNPKNRNGASSNIINELKSKKLKEVLAGVSNLKEGKIAEILDGFSGRDSNRVWKLKEGSLPENMNAATFHRQKGVLTVLDYNKLKDATNISVARTIIHELVHAYLILYFRYDAPNAAKEHPGIISAWHSTSRPNLNEIHHAEMVSGFQEHIAAAVKEYGQRLGLYLDDSVYSDLAWGGLDYQNNNQLEEESKKRIRRLLQAEQLGTPVTSSAEGARVTGK